jgi:hypothetical protein
VWQDVPEEQQQWDDAVHVGQDDVKREPAQLMSRPRMPPNPPS